MSGTRNYIIPILCIFLFIGAEAQNYKNKADIELVDRTGFYSVAITPGVSRYLKTDFRDLRIVDEKGNAVPYIIKRSLPTIKPAEFKIFNIISNELADSGSSIMIIENSGKEKIADFYLKIKNASVSRKIDLNGSDDMRHWFSITENLMLEKKFITDDDSYFEKIDFPLSTYQYFRLTIYNGKNDPLKIISAGRYSGESLKTTAPFIENPMLKFAQKDSSNHVCYITVFNPEQYHVNNISIHIKGPKFFKRDVDVVAAGVTLGNFMVSSDSLFHFNLPAFKDSVFEIKVYNGDNPPLKITSVSTGQEIKKAIAYLESGMHYSLQMNSESAIMPHYDLQNFKDSISADVPEIKISNIEGFANKSVGENKSIFKQTWVWPIIFIVLLVLTFFTLRLLKDVSKKNG